jgi:hypothetical protein
MANKRIAAVGMTMSKTIKPIPAIAEQAIR